MNFTTLQLMELHINTLFCLDEQGRLRCVNESGEPPAPLFTMGRTLQGNLWRFRHDLPASLVDELNRLCQSEPVTTDLASLPQNYAAIRKLLQEHLSQQALKEYRGPAYWIPASASRSATVEVVLISEANAELLRAAFPWMLPFEQMREHGPVAAVIEQGQAVSVCFSSRRPALAAEAGVETLPKFRGKGYATATVATWASALRRQKCLPLYSTSWENLASQAIARKLGMVFYGEDWSM